MDFFRTLQFLLSFVTVRRFLVDKHITHIYQIANGQYKINNRFQLKIQIWLFCPVCYLQIFRTGVMYILVCMLRKKRKYFLWIKRFFYGKLDCIRYLLSFSIAIVNGRIICKTLKLTNIYTLNIRAHMQNREKINNLKTEKKEIMHVKTYRKMATDFSFF